MNMDKTKKLFRTIIALMLMFALMLASPSAGISAYAKGGNFMKKNGIRTNLTSGGSTSIQTYINGVGYKGSKVTVLEYQKEDADQTKYPGYEVVGIKILVSSKKLKGAEVGNAIRATKKKGRIISGFNCIAMDGKTGKALVNGVDGIVLAGNLEKTGKYYQRSGKTGLTGYKYLTYYMVLAYPKERHDIYIGVTGVTQTSKTSSIKSFVKGNRKFTKTTMYSKSNKKLSTFIKVN